MALLHAMHEIAPLNGAAICRHFHNLYVHGEQENVSRSFSSTYAACARWVFVGQYRRTIPVAILPAA